MATQGPLYCGTGADDSGVGTVTWTNPGNISADDATFATASIASGSTTSHYLKGTNCGFTIPAGATINGIVVEIQHRSGGSSVAKDNRVRIVKGGTIGSTDRADATNWPTAETTVTYGSSSDLWGTTWTPTDINSSTFGAAVSALWVSGTNPAGVDFVRITVHYTPLKEFAAAGASTSDGAVVFKLIRKFVAAGGSTSSGSIVFERLSNNFSAAGASTSSGSIVFTRNPHHFVAAGASTSSGAVSFKLTRKATFAGGSVSAGSIFFETIYVYVTPEETEAHMSASLRQATPSTPDPQTQFVRVDGSGGAVVKGLLGVEHGITPGQGVEVLHGELILTLAEDMPAGTYIFTAKAIDEAWDASLVTYNTAPSVRATTGTTSESGLDAGDEITIDITDILDESVSLEGTTGQQWFGLELTVDGSEEIVFFGAFSVLYRPRIKKEVSRPPVAPFNLRPTSGLHVGELKPYFAWDFMDLDNEDTLSLIQVQLDTTDDFETPSYDSGEVASTTSVFDSASPPTGSAAFSNLTNTNSYYWRARHADNHGVWSEWSDPQSFTVTTKGSLTVDPTPLVPTPTISWSLSVTQQAYYVLIERYEGSWVPHWEQPWTTGTETEVTLPDSYVLQEGVPYRRTVRVTDTTDRSDLPGDRSFYEDVEEFEVAAVVMV